MIYVNLINGAIAIWVVFYDVVVSLEDHDMINEQNVPITFVCNYKSMKTDGDTDTFITKHSSKACFSNQTSQEYQFPEDWTGEYFNFELNNAQITSLQVLNNYDRTKRSIDIQFNTLWSTIDGINITALYQAVNESTVVSMAFSTYINPDYPIQCAGNTLMSVDGAFCERDTFYEAVIGEKPEFRAGDCVINKQKQTTYYLGLWESVAPTGVLFKKTCILNTSINVNYFDDYKDKRLATEYQEFFACEKRKEIGCTPAQRAECYCQDPKYKITWIANNARGTLSKLRFTSSSDPGTINLDMTVMMQEWNLQFPDVFMQSFNMCDFQLWQTTLKVKVFIKDPDIIQEPAPSFIYWFIANVMIVPCFVLVVALIIMFCTRSTRGLETNIWDYFKVCEKCFSRDEKFDFELKEEAFREDDYRISEMP